MRGLYFCIRTPCAGHAQTRAGAAPVSFIYIDREGGKRAALFRAGLAEAEGRAEAGRARPRTGTAERKSGGARERRRNAAKATRRERAELAVKRPARGREESRPVKRPARGKRRTGKKNCAVCSPDPVVGDRKPPAEPGNNGQKQAGSDAVRGGIVHFSRSFGERSHKPPFFVPFGHPVVISER